MASYRARNLAVPQSHATAATTATTTGFRIAALVGFLVLVLLAAVPGFPIGWTLPWDLGQRHALATQVERHQDAAQHLRDAEAALLDADPLRAEAAASETLTLLADADDRTRPAALRARAHEILAEIATQDGRTAAGRTHLRAARDHYREAGIGIAADRIAARLAEPAPDAGAPPASP